MRRPLSTGTFSGCPVAAGEGLPSLTSCHSLGLSHSGPFVTTDCIPHAHRLGPTQAIIPGAQRGKGGRSGHIASVAGAEKWRWQFHPPGRRQACDTSPHRRGQAISERDRAGTFDRRTGAVKLPPRKGLGGAPIEAGTSPYAVAMGTCHKLASSGEYRNCPLGHCTRGQHRSSAAAHLEVIRDLCFCGAVDHCL
jgi:hypothetical protein